MELFLINVFNIYQKQLVDNNESFPCVWCQSKATELVLNVLTMKQAFIQINEVQTSVTTWGPWIEDNLEENEEIILCIPGNPSLPGFYKRFLETIHNRLGLPVWLVSHAGHEEPDDFSPGLPLLKGNEHMYDTKGQIDHKRTFIRKYIPKGTRIHMIGHSVGAYTILQLMKNEDINSRIASCILLFPTLDNLAETPNGKFMITCIKPLYNIILFLSHLFCLLPKFIAYLLVQLYFFITFVPKHNIPATLQLIMPSVLEKIFYMAFDEMKCIGSMDIDVIRSNSDKLKFYYGATDHWAPVTQCDKLVSLCPNADAEICTRRINHAFVLRSSEVMGNLVAEWIEDWKADKKIKSLY